MNHGNIVIFLGDSMETRCGFSDGTKTPCGPLGQVVQLKLVPRHLSGRSDVRIQAWWGGGQAEIARSITPSPVPLQTTRVSGGAIG